MLIAHGGSIVLQLRASTTNSRAFSAREGTERKENGRKTQEKQRERARVQCARARRGRGPTETETKKATDRPTDRQTVSGERDGTEKTFYNASSHRVTSKLCGKSRRESRTGLTWKKRTRETYRETSAVYPPPDKINTHTSLRILVCEQRYMKRQALSTPRRDRRPRF